MYEKDKNKSKFQSKYTSVLEDENKSQHQVKLVKDVEALGNVETWSKWLSFEYQSYVFEDGKKYPASILDNCPACCGTGIIGQTVERSAYGYNGEYSEGLACSVCLTGKNKSERLGLPFAEKSICAYSTKCPLPKDFLKSEKCKKCICKFDPDFQKNIKNLSEKRYEMFAKKMINSLNQSDAQKKLASRVSEKLERLLEV